jgi:hypothetical protein
MKNWHTRGFVSLLGGLLIYGCTSSEGDDDGPDQAGSGGKAGASGGSSSGKGGAAGKAGSGGKSGTAGTTGQGDAGANDGGRDQGGAGTPPVDAGAGGESGGAGAGGTGGTGGTGGSAAGAGSGGEAGEAEIPERSCGLNTSDPVTLVWGEGFEDGATDWTITGGVWAVGTPTFTSAPSAFAGSGLAGTGLGANYGASQDAWLISRVIEVPAAIDNPRFSFRYWYELAAGDTGYVYVRVVGGSWTLLATFDQTGDDSWRKMVVNLDAYADQSVEFGFRLYTNGAAFAPGVFVDEASFETGPVAFQKCDGFEEDWGYWSAVGGVWAVGEPTAADGPEPFEGERVAGTILSGDYGASQDAWLIGPRIPVPPAKEHPRLSLKYWYEFAAGDTGYAYVRVDGGSWNLLFNIDQSGDGSWRNLTLPLDAYADRDVEIAFRLYTNGSAFAPGLYVDDFYYGTGKVVVPRVEGFEDGFADWSALGGVWAVGAPTADDGPEPHTGDAVAGTILSGDYGASQDAWLVSPRFHVPEESDDPNVSYYYWYEFASGDTGYTYLRVDGGSWQLLNTIDQSGGNAWRRQSIDLTPYKDREVEIGFRLYTNGSTFAPGYYIDDVAFNLE